MSALLIYSILSSSSSIIIALSTNKVSMTSTEAPAGLCYNKLGEGLQPLQFNQRAGVFCYMFLNFNVPFNAVYPFYSFTTYTVSGNATHEGETIYPDVRNETSVKLVYSSLNNEHDKTERWLSCAQQANICCEKQFLMPVNVSHNHCPRIWDGYSCWGDTPAGVYATTSCPAYLEHAIHTRKAVKICKDDSNWYAKPDGPGSWTDYTPCLDKASYIAGVYFTLACNIISIAFLFPSLCIFCAFRELLKQHRVRLHINFFISLLLSGTASILWFILVHHDTLVNDVSTETVMYRNPVWCRCLSFFKIYFESTTFFWMFCEGYFLHRLISNAFEPPKSLIPLYLFGWGLPAIPSLIYSTLRKYVGNESCWTKNIGGYQWIIYAPNFICLTLNMVFLFNILRILLFQMHSHPHEPSNFRRGLKAALMLVPLFGLQLFLTIYRPPPDAPGIHVYEYITFFMKNSQGVFVSLIFCIFNGEVMNQMRRHCACYRRFRRNRLDNSQGPTSITQVTTYEVRQNGTDNVELPMATELELKEMNGSNGEIIQADQKSNNGGYIPLTS